MSQNNTAQEKTEQPTPKRLRDARDKGQVPRSRELVTLVVVTAGVAGTMALGPWLARRALGFLRDRLQFGNELALEPDAMAQGLAAALWDALIWTSPFLLFGSISAVAATWLFGGWVFSGQLLAPDFSRIDPIKGLGRVFSLNALLELGKAIAKFGLLGTMVAIAIWQSADTLLGLATMDVHQAVGRGLALCLAVLLALCGGLALIAAIDMPLQKIQFARKMRMTKQEVRDELKEVEGRPEVKARVRQLQQEMSQRRIMEAVPGADVVVTNPRHFAVALKYQSATMSAPVVVAKGADELAAILRDLAGQHRVPIVAAAPLARSLYRHVPIDREVPVALYAAVAQILSYVYQLRQPKAPRPSRPRIEIPEELRWEPPAQ